jgi:tetratricopeptide (TPR) repeat protein
VANFEKAEAIPGKLIERAPADDSLRRDYVRVANMLAHSYASSGQFAKSLALVQKTTALAETGMRSNPADPRHVQAVIASLTAAADVRTDQQQYAEAIPFRERIEALSATLTRLQPDNLEAVRTLALAKKKLGALYGVSKRYDDARRKYEEAARLDEQRLAHNPNDARAKLDLSFDYSDLGWVAGRLQRFPDSLIDYERVLALRTEVAQADPKDRRAADSVASAMTRLGMARLGMARLGMARLNVGDTPAAERDLRRAVAMYEGIVEHNDTGWAVVRDLAIAHDDLADVLEAGCGKSKDRPACLAHAAVEVTAERTLLDGLKQKGQLPKADSGWLAATMEREAKLKRGGR